MARRATIETKTQMSAWRKGLCHRAVPERMGAKRRGGPLNRWETRGLPSTRTTRAPGTDVVTATPRKALDGEVPRRLLVVVVPRDVPEGGEVNPEMVEEGVCLMR